MKTYCICYSTTISFDTVVRAKNKEEAIAKVKEVIGDPVVVEGAWEVAKKKKDAYAVVLP